MDKRKNRQAHRIVKHRPLIQAAATILCNIHLPNLLKGQIYQGQTKALCVPGLNCYSCPAATGACPIGALQSVAGSSRFSISYYVSILSKICMRYKGIKKFYMMVRLQFLRRNNLFIPI